MKSAVSMVSSISRLAEGVGLVSMKEMVESTSSHILIVKSVFSKISYRQSGPVRSLRSAILMFDMDKSAVIQYSDEPLRKYWRGSSLRFCAESTWSIFRSHHEFFHETILSIANAEIVL